MNNKTEDEMWKTYPEFYFIQGSTRGRIRTIDRYVKTKNGNRLIKGHILKQYLSKNGYLYVSFGVGGKTVHRLAHRIIAACHLPNSLSLPEINHKDCDPLNNNISNLEWCTHEQNMAYKENYGKSSAEVSGCPVYAVSLNTLEAYYFKSQSEASHELGIAQSSINSVIKGQLNQAGGHWFIEDNGDDFKIDKNKLCEIKAGMYSRGGIYAVNLETLEVLRFESQTESSRKLGIDQSNISRILKGAQKTAGGYWFTKADSSAIETTRAKFGNEVANRVSELMSEK